MFKKITADAILPKRQTRFSAGFDVFANEDKVIAAGQTELIGLGIAIDLDDWYYEISYRHARKNNNSHIASANIAYQSVEDFKNKFLLELHIRSSLRVKGLTSLGTGVIDMDFDQEVKMAIHNPICGYEDVDHCDYGLISMPFGASMFKGETNPNYEIKKGDKIGQLILLPHAGHLMPDEYTLDNERVGGFGSSGTK